MAVSKDIEKGIWTSQIWVEDWQGKKKHKKKRGFASKKEALEWERNTLLASKTDMNMKLADFVEVYFRDKSGELKQRTIRNKRYMIEHHIIPLLGNRAMDSISPADIIQWQNEIRTKGFKETYQRTAIYHGIEDMYEETKDSLHLIDPITYLGYVKRNDINIVIDTPKKAKGERSEYETDKFNDIVDAIKRSKITGKKTLIYFPTVSLIDGCWQYLENKGMVNGVTKYYGPLPKDQKNENYQSFYNGEKTVMLATKAFGMGIDIDNIEIVVHYASTGNVCDYVQEIGRAARKKELRGEAYYHYNSRDFKFINRLHGLSTIKKYQLIEVIKKIDELYVMNLRRKSIGHMTKRRNAMLIDAENFTYIFDNPISDADDNINRVKTALLIIQKDFEAKIGFSPITVRPIPLFSLGFFAIEPTTQGVYVDS